MDFGPNISPVDVIKKDAFGGTYFRNIYSSVNDKFYKNSWKEFKELESIDKKYCRSDLYDVSLNFNGVECGTSLRFWGKNGWIRPVDPNGWFQWCFRYLKGRRSKDDQRQIGRWKRIVSRFVGILKKMTDKSSDLKVRQILLHQCYELE